MCVSHSLTVSKHSMHYTQDGKGILPEERSAAAKSKENLQCSLQHHIEAVADTTDVDARYLACRASHQSPLADAF